ncbi:MAG: hypothetical protein AAGB00_06560 [Planctomycetota bacterium]
MAEPDTKPAPRLLDAAGPTEARAAAAAASRRNAASRDATRDRLLAAYRRRIAAGDVPWSAVGIGAATAAFLTPFFLAALVALVGVPIAIVGGGLSSQDLASGLIMGAGGLLVLSGAAFLLAGVAAALTLPLVAIAAALLNVRARQTVFACFGGGAVMAAASLPLVATIAYESDGWAYAVIAVLLGLVTPIGQFGSGYFLVVNAAVCRPVRNKLAGDCSTDRQGRFRLSQIMALMAVVSGGLAALNATGLLRSPVMLILAPWASYQFFTLWLAVMLVDWRRRRGIDRLLADTAERANRPSRIAPADTRLGGWA